MPRRFGRRPAFRRRRRFVRRRGRASAWSRGLRSVGSIARQVWRLKGLVNSEMYKYDTQATGTVTDGGGVTQITNIAIGDSASTRTGNSIFVRSVNWKGQVFRTTSGNALQTVRIGVFYDAQQLADTAPVYTDVFSGATVYSHLNAATVGRFKILANRVFTLSSAGTLGIPFEINLPMRHHVRYNGSASTDIQKGALYVFVISDQASANYPSIQSEVRVSYHDN